MIKQLRRGQAEVLGGLMVVSVLLLIIIPLILNTMTSSTNVGTRNYVLRSQFEIERWSERLVLSADRTRLENPSAVDITIVRIWRNISGRSEPIDLPRPISISVGGYLPINQLVSNLGELEAVVTARGRVIKIQELLPPPPREVEGRLPLGLTGDEITGGNKLFEQNISIIKCKYGGDDCNTPYPAIYYNRTWWIYIDTTRRWVNASREGIPIPSTELRFTDMDGNNAPELLILHKRDKRDSNYYVLDTENSRRFEYAINFSRYASIKENTTLVSVFLKVVIGFSNSSEFSASIRIILAKSENPSLTISNYATLLSTKIPRSDLNMTIYEGYVMFPVRQFDYFNSIIYNNPGIYDVIVEVYVETQGNVEAAAGIEYIAVTSYSY